MTRRWPRRTGLRCCGTLRTTTFAEAAELLQRGVDFALKALDDSDSRVFIHCAAGVHRAPMMALAVLRALGFSREDAMHMIQARRNVVDFADVYVESVEDFMRSYERAGQAKG